ncbi:MULTISPECIES: penicillin-binding transpeptidase domain-containing protein [unclassified Streptomyces]|uniref:caspase, EACC1-associated type n=1 Tax=unclassified Streptomyces TaxID=2593676 RepID=UPI00225585B2|nr:MULTISPECIES: penicillin-binding transpeptidase domain-containing protein [unclassified Streptomyces]MCX5329744.1 penicillin-binding transpeptidase domain-containing protein [Streptomyces sp. NBC_00140]MCX5359159.1 penicillin-binding transpeptidase domain-containing protein [Streptomyces sp. NBC_00124]
MRERRRHALLVATSSYEDPSLRALWAPLRDATELARLLGDRAIGDFTVDVLNDPGAHELRRGVEDFFADCSVTDTLLLHFACHGLKDEGGKLFLSAADTVRTRLESTAIPAEYVSRLMMRSRAGRAAVMLDCCYAGAFERGLFSRADPEVHVEDSFSALERAGGERGRAVLTASSAVEYAFEGARVVSSAIAGTTMGAGLAEGQPGPSLFTGALVEGLRTGDADLGGDGVVGLAELAEYIRGRVREATPHQNPQLWMFGAYGDLTIARAVRSQDLVTLPMGVDVQAETEALDQRLRRVAELRTLLDGRDVPRALDAFAELGRFARDDDASVREAARQARAGAAPRTTQTHLHLGVLVAGQPGPRTAVPIFGPPVAEAVMEISSDSAWLRVRPDAQGMTVSALVETPGVHEGRVTVRSATGKCELTVSAEAVLPEEPLPVVTLGQAEPPGQSPAVRPAGRRVLLGAHAVVAVLSVSAVLALGIRTAVVPGQQVSNAFLAFAVGTVLYLTGTALATRTGRTPLPRLSRRGGLLHGTAVVSTVGAVVAASLLGQPADEPVGRYDRPRGDILVEGKRVTGSNAIGGDQPYVRTYTDGELYAAVTGYASQTAGTSLLERAEDGVLTATRSSQKAGDVSTTIDAAAQKAAFNGLGDRQGAVVALDPHTGAILALVSTPSYDPATFAGNTSVDSQNWGELKQDSDHPLVNRALGQTFAPGSAFKVVTAAAALENGLYDSIDEKTDTPAPWSLPGTTTKLSDAPDTLCENVSLRQALSESCNTVFAKIGSDVGSAKMRAQAEKFGFNSAQEIPVPTNESVYPDDAQPAQNALSAIGQYETTATPLQMAMVAAAVGNDGTLMRPYLVRDGDTGTGTLSRPLSKANADKLRKMMRAVVDSGTGTDAAIEGVEVGGKTGTAQKGTGNLKSPLSWFISYAKPDPDSPATVAVAVAVVEKEADSDDTFGGVSATIAKRVMQAVLDK